MSHWTVFESRSLRNKLSLSLLAVMSGLIVSYLTVSCSHTQKTNETSLTPLAPPTRIEVQAHRGGRGRFPENSMPAFEYAITIGADVLELDLGISKDGELIISHDPALNIEQCVAPGGYKIPENMLISTLTLAQIKTYTCGHLPYARFPKQKKLNVSYATLRELFDFIKASKIPNAKTIGLNIETKIIPGRPNDTATPEVFAKKITALLQEYGFTDRATLQSFDHRSLVESKKIDPKLRISPLTENTLFTNLPAIAKELHAEILSPNLFWITKGDVESLHRVGVRVIPWTANEQKEWDMLIGLGVDGIISDYPEELLAYLKSKNLH